MKYLVWILVLFVAAAAITEASHNQAYLLLVYQPYRIEVSLNIFVCALLFLFVFGYSLIRLVLATLRLPESVRQFRLKQSQEKSKQLLEKSLTAYFEGRYAAAESAASQAMSLGDKSPFHAVIAARAAYQLRQTEKCERYLATCETDLPMRLFAEAEFILEKQPKLALELLTQLKEKHQAGVLMLQLRAHQLLGQNDETLSLVDQLEKQTVLDSQSAQKLRVKIWLQKIEQTSDVAALTLSLRTLPDELRLLLEVSVAVVRQYIRLAGYAQAQDWIEDNLKQVWYSELAGLYSECVGDDVLAQIAQAEKWLIQHKNDAQLLLSLGRLCLQQGLWGKAQGYLDASLSISPSPAAYNALAQLAEKTDRPQDISRYHQQAMLLQQLREGA